MDFEIQLNEVEEWRETTFYVPLWLEYYNQIRNTKHLSNNFDKTFSFLLFLNHSNDTVPEMIVAMKIY